MNAELKGAFARIKPICDMVMINPTPDNIHAFTVLARELKKESLRDLQQYMLYPIITHIQSKEIDGRHELQRLLVNAMKEVLDRISVSSFEMCIRIEMSLSKIAFDKDKPGMIADIPEELKLSVMQCMTSLMLNLETPLRLKIIKSHAPLLAQAIFVSVHMAKMEKLRTLRLAALDSLLAHTSMHSKLTDTNFMITDPVLEEAVVHMLSCILPGVLATLQDVAVCANNPGHAVVTLALNATHRILCMTMNDKHMKSKCTLTAADFVKVIEQKDNPNYVSKGKTCELPKLSMEWYEMAGEKLEAVIRSLVRLVTHEHYRVRRELAVLCYRVLSECSSTMQPSVAMCLDVLICLSSDAYPQVAAYCARARAPPGGPPGLPGLPALPGDALVRNLFTVLDSLPRVLNNIDPARKLAALRLLEGYLAALGGGGRLRGALAAGGGCSRLCDSLLCAAALHADLVLLTRHAARDVTATPPTDSPWCQFRHLDNAECVLKFQQICQQLGGSECAHLLLDTLLETFRERRDCELIYIMNWMASAPNSPPSLARTVLDTYLEEDVWLPPLEVGPAEPPPAEGETLDVSVYNPRAWTRESVPGLYEGTTETRYTDVSYLRPRAPGGLAGARGGAACAPGTCRSLRQAQRNMVQCCLLTEGLGQLARRLGGDFQPFLLKTLCLVLERVGSRYEMLHLAGVKAINDVRAAGGYGSVGQLIASNADYFTNEITKRLKRAWDTQSALEILSVVMEYSDGAVLEYMYGIMEDVLVLSCDKYYQTNLHSYLQVFYTFVNCIYKWFPDHNQSADTQHTTKEIDIFNDVIEYIRSEQEADSWMSTGEKDNKSVEDMIAEDMEQRENDVLDYDDSVTREAPPLPKHIEVTKAILQRCVHFIPTRDRHDAVLTLRVLTRGLPALGAHEDELLPLAHAVWGPLAARFRPAGDGRGAGDADGDGDADAAVLRRALDLLVTLAMLCKDFIRDRAVKEVLPRVYEQLRRLAAVSRLQDAGSSYRLSARFHLQLAALAALAPLAVRLRLRLRELHAAMRCAAPYLSDRQPRPLQTLAIEFFKAVLAYDYGAGWLHLRRFCAASAPPPCPSPPAGPAPPAALTPPRAPLPLATLAGSPHDTADKEYDKNIKAIFDM